MYLRTLSLLALGLWSCGRAQDDGSSVSAVDASSAAAAPEEASKCRVPISTIEDDSFYRTSITADVDQISEETAKKCHNTTGLTVESADGKIKLTSDFFRVEYLYEGFLDGRTFNFPSQLPKGLVKVCQIYKAQGAQKAEVENCTHVILGDLPANQKMELRYPVAKEQGEEPAEIQNGRVLYSASASNTTNTSQAVDINFKINGSDISYDFTPYKVPFHSTPNRGYQHGQLTLTLNQPFNVATVPHEAQFIAAYRGDSRISSWTRIRKRVPYAVSSSSKAPTLTHVTYESDTSASHGDPVSTNPDVAKGVITITARGLKPDTDYAIAIDGGAYFHNPRNNYLSVADRPELQKRNDLVRFHSPKQIGPNQEVTLKASQGGYPLFVGTYRASLLEVDAIDRDLYWNTDFTLVGETLQFTVIDRRETKSVACGAFYQKKGAYSFSQAPSALGCAVEVGASTTPATCSGRGDRFGINCDIDVSIDGPDSPLLTSVQALSTVPGANSCGKLSTDLRCYQILRDGPVACGVNVNCEGKQ